MWPNQQETGDLVTFIEKTLMENFFVQWLLQGVIYCLFIVYYLLS